MKLRKIGNSLGTTFSKELLERAGFLEDQDLDVVAKPGEIVIRAGEGHIIVEFTPSEAKALTTGKFGSKAGESAVAKVRKVVDRN